MASYKTNEEELITKISMVKKTYKNYIKFVGIAFTTPKQVIELLISKEQSCCETFSINVIIGGKKVVIRSGCYYDKEEFDEVAKMILGQSICSINFGADMKNYDGMTCGIPVLIGTNKLPFEVQIYNHHDGYYPHSYHVSWYGYKDSGYI